MKTIKKPKIKKIEKVNTTATETSGTTLNPIGDVDIAKVSLNSEQVIKIASFSGDFGRVDINLLRDKVNEIIDFLNNK